MDMYSSIAWFMLILITSTCDRCHLAVVGRPIFTPQLKTKLSTTLRNVEGGCGFFRSDRSVALSLKKERKDLVKTACVSIIWEMTGRDEGTKESKAVRPAQKSTKRITLIFQTQISMSWQPLTLPLKRTTSLVSGVRWTCASSAWRVASLQAGPKAPSPEKASCLAQVSIIQTQRLDSVNLRCSLLQF